MLVSIIVYWDIELTLITKFEVHLKDIIWNTIKSIFTNREFNVGFVSWNGLDRAIEGMAEGNKGTNTSLYVYMSLCHVVLLRLIHRSWYYKINLKAI